MSIFMPAIAQHRLFSVDEFLGHRDGRYFGEGFKRVRHRLDEVKIRPGSIEATAGLSLPGLWSRKGGDRQVPHLSTIDAMLFAGRLTGMYLAHTHRLDADSAADIEEVKIKAGNSPDEDGLERFGVEAHHLSTEPFGARARTALDCRIGSMSVRTTAVHDATGTETARAGYYLEPEDLPGPWNDRPFGFDHLRRRQFLRDVAVDGSDLAAEADLVLDPDGGDPTMIDVFTAALQLGQVLLYRLDAMRREDSETLWMRRTEIRRSSTTTDSRFRTALTNSTLLTTPKGTWRAARIHCDHGGYEMSCQVAHMLPADRVTSERGHS